MRPGRTLLLTTVCPALTVLAGNPPQCKEIAGAGQFWGMPALRFILVGGMHDTREALAIFADLVCAAGATDRLGVTRTLLSQPGWHSLDGRSSQSMLGLIETLGAFKRDGWIAAVVEFSDSNGWHRRSKPRRTATPTRS